MVSLLLLLSLASAVELADGVSDPHGDPAACAECHEAAGPTPGPALKPIGDNCLRCHLDADMHPVDVEAVETAIPDGWPLQAGLTTCWTCHMEPACSGAKPLPAPYLRGGPYPRVDDQCFQCHDRGEFTRERPHHPSAPRSEDEGFCSACHTGRPELGAAPEDARLREVEGGVCSTCHEGEPHYGARSHMLEEVEPEQRAQLPDAVALPKDGSVRCWSCHEVHDPTPPPPRRWRSDHPLGQALRAAVRVEWGLEGELSWPGETPAEHPPMLALPLEDGALCRACHAEGDK